MKSIMKVNRENASPKLNSIFDKIESAYGKVLNLFAILGNSENALESYLQFSNAQVKNSFSPIEREVIYLAASETNGCIYCVSAHTLKAKMLGLSDEEIIEVREGIYPDPKFETLITLTSEIIKNRGNVEESVISDFYGAGYNQENLVDLIALITEMTFSNYLGRLSKPCIDFPQAPILSEKVIV